MSDEQDFGFNDPENAKNYAVGGPGNFVPGFAVMHRLVVQLLSETAGEGAQILVLGAGGGHELKAFAEARPSWRYVAVDPAKPMLDEAKRALGAAADRTQWIEGVIDDVPAMQADAATCLLTLHILPNDSVKLATLRAIRERLKPGGSFALVDNCVDCASPDAGRWMDRYVAFGVESGVPRENAEMFRERIQEAATTNSPEHEVRLLAEAGFTNIDLFFAGLSWRGWIAKAGAAE